MSEVKYKTIITWFYGPVNEYEDCFPSLELEDECLDLITSDGSIVHSYDLFKIKSIVVEFE